MNDHSQLILDKVTSLLELRAASLGINSFSVNNEILPTHLALAPVGPVAGLLALHAQTMANLTSGDHHSLTSRLPVCFATCDQSPFGSRIDIQPSTMPFSFAVAYLDAALEHASCIGMRSLGYTPSEWYDLPENMKTIPLEPYFDDLRANWITEAVELDNKAQILAAWPQLIDIEGLNALSQQNEQKQGASNALRFNSAR